MSTKLIPLFLEINISFTKELTHFLDNKQLDLKKRFKFEEIEIKNNVAKFKNGFPIISLVIKDMRLEIISIFRDREEAYSEILNVLKVMNFAEDDKLTILKFRLISILNFDNEQSLHNFFISSPEPLGEIMESSLKFQLLRDLKKIMYQFEFQSDGQANFANISLETPNEVNIKNFMVSCQESESILRDSMDSFLTTRNLPVSFIGG
ncbi:hypothetical protein M3226_05135 [Neobacillus cucumis]|uniref:hypothetical protein n=1 Tax=Neobacillus cucumis TaxID=1740721 RepID=UPI0020404F73|nr:hypothetical protein [Neobacillus cucumis]MCM3725081.1 hypothetical protein [Neobacillus cucumis]